MKLNFVNRTADDLGSALGIQEERRKEISKQLDQFVLRFREPTLVYMADIYEFISEVTWSDEEFVWALSLHLQWCFHNNKVIPCQK